MKEKVTVTMLAIIVINHDLSLRLSSDSTLVSASSQRECLRRSFLLATALSSA